MNEPLTALTYRKKQLNLSSDIKARDYYSLAKYYLAAELPDSTIFYCKKVIDIADSTDTGLYYYYKLLANARFSTQRYEKAYRDIIAANKLYEQNIKKYTDRKITEIQEKYDYSESLPQ